VTLPTAILADDHEIVVAGLRNLLAEHLDIVTTCSSGGELLDAIRRYNVDVVIADISMPDLSGIEVLRAIRHDARRPRVILLSMYDEAEIVQAALAAGARGYVPKQAAGTELVSAVRRAMAGGTYISPMLAGRSAARRAEKAKGSRPQLSERQREVLQLVAAGQRMKEIASRLKLSRRTVEMHKYDAMRILGFRTTAELIRYYVRNESRLQPGRRIGTSAE
jgi:DNA-binding NarL/FixJ family response regulator